MGIGYALGRRPRGHRGPGRDLEPAARGDASRAPAASCSTSPAAVDLGLFEVNEAAEIIHGVAHPDANIIFGAVIDDEMGDEVRVTVIAAGFDRWDEGKTPRRAAPRRGRRPERPSTPTTCSADDDDDDLDDGDDDFDVPSFLK